MFGSWCGCGLALSCYLWYVLIFIALVLWLDQPSRKSKRAENVIYKMITQNAADLLYLLPLGISAPLKEATRTCQLASPGNWPLDAYQAIGHNDLAASVSENPDMLYSDGYRSRRDFIVSTENLFQVNFWLTGLFQGAGNNWRNNCGISHIGWRWNRCSFQRGS